MSEPDRSDLRTHREALAGRLRRIGSCPAERFAGRGIVICAGGSRMFTNAYVLAWVLRHQLRSRLPLEIWHLGPGELSPSMAALLEQLDVDTIDATARIKQQRGTIRDGWQLKAYALVETRFQEVLLLDADQVPTRDPEAAFAWAEYAASGAVFWPDIVDLSCENPIWTFCDIHTDQRVSFETGQLLVDKVRHWQALHAALYLNEHADVFYRLVYGDKDTFLAAWLFTRAEHALVPHRPLIDERCLFQRDFSGEVIFQHRVGAKWTYSGQQHDVPGFVHFDACLKAIGELRSKWSGRVFHPPARSLRARQTEVRLAQHGALILRLPGESDKPIRLLPYGEVAEGRSLDIQHWFVRQTERALEIVFHDGYRETYRFHATNQGRWSGRAAIKPFGEAHLLPSEACSETAERSDSGMSLAADIVRAELSVSPFDGKMAQRLETIFTVIARAEPRLITDVLNLSRSLGENTPLGAHLQSLAGRLVGANEESKPFQRSEGSMLHDPLRYVWP